MAMMLVPAATSPHAQHPLGRATSRATARGRHVARTRLPSVAAVETQSKNWFMPKPKSAVPEVIPDSWPSMEARKALFGAAPEQVEPVEATLTGTIPDWLQGSLIINGGGDYTLMRHMFDGYAVLLKTEIKNGKVYGSQRYLKTQVYDAYKKTGKVPALEFATSPTWKNKQEQLQFVWNNIVQVVTKNLQLTDNASVTLNPLPDGTLLALSEVKTAGYKVDPKTLETLEQVKLFDDGYMDTIRTAHLKRLPDGSYVGMSTNLPLGKYVIYKMDPHTLKRTILATIPHREFTPAWIHDFAVSENYVAIIEPPVFFTFGSLVAGSLDGDVAGMMNWKPRLGTRVYVVPLDGSGQVKTFNAPAFFMFHFCNAFEREDGEYLYVDVCSQENAERVNELFIDRLMKFPGEDSSNSVLRRLSIPLKAQPTGNALQDLLFPPQSLVDDEYEYGANSDFPTVNPRYLGKRQRYVYMCATMRPSNLLNAWAKIDVQEKRTVAMWHLPGCSTAEPTFVPTPNAESEDEGVVIGHAVLGNGHVVLVVLDGQTFEQLAIAELPFGTGARFHGTWLPATN